MKALIPVLLFLSFSLTAVAQSEPAKLIPQKCVELAFKRNLEAFRTLTTHTGMTKLDKHKLAEQYSDLVDQMDYAYHEYPILKQRQETISAVAAVNRKKQDQ